MANLLNNIPIWFSNSGFSGFLPRVSAKDALQIVLLTLLIYYGIKHLKGTRAWVLAKGVIVILFIYTLAFLMKLDVIVELFQSVITFLIIAIIIAIQPEIRRFVEGLGAKSINSSLIDNVVQLFKNSGKEEEYLISDATIKEIVKGCFAMGAVKTGALIVIERKIPLNDYVDTGIAVNADISSALLINTFEKNTPLHDGAIIIQNDKLVAATCYLPISENKEISKNLGTTVMAYRLNPIFVEACKDLLYS